MPRLPLYLATGNLFQAIPTAAPDMTAWNAAAISSYMAGRGIAQISGQVGAALQESAEKTRQAQQSMAALKAYTAASVQAEELKGTLERDPDYEAVPQKMEAGLRDIYARQSEALTDPGARQLFARDFLKLTMHKSVEAAQLRNTRRIDNGLADLAASTDALKTMAADSHPSALPGILQRVSLAYRDAALGGLLSQAEATKREGAAITDIVEGAARQDADRDPDGAAGRIGAGEGLYRLLPADKRVQLKEHATTQGRQRAERAEQLERDTLAVAEKELKELEKRTEATRKAAVDSLESRALAGQVDLLDVEAAREARILQGEDYRRIRKAVTDPKDMPSDPTTLETLALDAESQYPKTTPGKVDQLYQAGKLNLKDAVEIKGKLRQRAKANEEKADPELTRRHNQAEQLLRSGLTTRSPFEALDPVSQEMQTVALRELTRRSNLFDGTEDPLAVVNEILPKYQQTLTDRGRVSVTNARKLVGTWTPQSLDAAKAAGTLAPGQYETIRDALVSLARAEQDLEAANARRGTPQPGKKP